MSLSKGELVDRLILVTNDFNALGEHLKELTKDKDALKKKRKAFIDMYSDHINSEALAVDRLNARLSNVHTQLFQLKRKLNKNIFERIMFAISYNPALSNSAKSGITIQK